MDEDVGFAVMVKTDCPHISKHLNMDLADLSLASKKRTQKKNFSKTFQSLKVVLFATIKKKTGCA
jgi:hypothetical protein